MKERRVVPALSLASGLVACVVGYALVRAAQCLVQGEAAPPMIGWSTHIAYFWRIATVAYAGGMTAFSVFLGARGHPGAAARALARAIPLAAALLALQAAFFP